MSLEDRERWDARYRESAGVTGGPAEPPARFAAHVDRFPTTGLALDLACGRGEGSVWLAGRGLDVLGVDVSPVAVAQADALAAACGVADRCRFLVWDLDDGLPDGPPVDVVLCHRFRDARLDRAIVDRLAAGGLLAVVARSEVGATTGRFRVAAGELPAAFGDLEPIVADEGEGEAWLLARRSRR